MSNKPLYVFKIVVLGEGGVGKTTMIRRLCYQKYMPQKLTIGADLASYDLEIDDNPYKLQLWDFAGEKRFRFFLPSYCKGAVGALLVFDLARYSTFKKLNEWYEIVTQNSKHLTIILVGSKCDLVKAKGAIDFEEVLEFQKSHNIEGYIETSSKTGENNKDVFEQLVRKIKDKMNKNI